MSPHYSFIFPNDLTRKLHTKLRLLYGVLCSAYRPLSDNLDCLLVSMSLWGREDTWQVSESINTLAERLGTSNCELFRRPLLPSCCCRCVFAAVFSVSGKFWRAFRRKLVVIVQRKLCSISKLFCRSCNDLSTFSIVAIQHPDTYIWEQRSNRKE